jgi:hypothetical protein
MKRIITFLFICLINVSFSQSNSINFEWAKQTSASVASEGYSVVSDNSGNVYMTGYFNGTVDFDPGPGTYNLTAQDGDIFVQKLDNNGNFIWANKYGSSGFEYGNSITIDEFSNVYVCGSRQTSTSSSIKILKFNSNGSYSWERGWLNSSSLNNSANSIMYDGAGNIIITGSFEGAIDFVEVPGTYYLNSTGEADIFVMKLTASGGAFVWAKNISGSSYETSSSLSLDPTGNIYIGGFFVGTTDFDPSAYSNILNATDPSGNGFVVKLNSDGNYLWAQQISCQSHVGAIKSDEFGNLCTTGSFNGQADFDPGAGTYNLSGSQAIFIQKINLNGDLIWVKQISGSTSNDGAEIKSVTNDKIGNIFITGYFSGTYDFDPSASQDIYSTAFGFNNIFIEKFDEYGNKIWVKSLGAGYGNSISSSSFSDIYITGGFNDFLDINSNIQLLNSNGYTDLYVAKISPCNKITVNENICNGETYTFGSSVYNQSGSYTKGFIDQNGCDSIVTLNLTVLPNNFNPTFSSNQQLYTAPPFVVQFTNSTANAPNYSFTWDFGDGTTLASNNTSVFHQYSYNGQYTVSLIATNNITSCSDTTTLSDFIFCTGGITSGMNEEIYSIIQIYPNPTNANLTLEVSNDLIGKSYFIKDFAGRIIHQGKINSSKEQIDLQAISNGSYFLQVEGKAIQVVKQ